VIAPSTLGLVLVVCLIAQAFFVAAEGALAGCDRNRLRQRVAGGDQRARRAERMLDMPQIALATTLVGATLAMLIAVLLVGVELAVRGVTPLWAPLFVAPPLLVLGTMLPKALVQAHADAVVDALAGPLRLASFVLRPIVVVVGGYASLLTRLTRSDRKDAFVTRDELARLIELAPETDKPEIGADERAMIANVFELSEYDVGELMVPLSEVTALPEDAQISEAALEVADKQHSRMPIYRSRVDDVVGIVHVFDLLQAASRGGKSETVASLAHPPIYVPQTMKASDLLVQLQTEQQHLAIVVDEYGGAVGICTIEDLLEIIVGDIDDEYDTEPSPIKHERPGVWRVEARTSVARVNTELDVGLPESEDYETVAGLLIEKLRHIPAKGEALTLPHVIIEVVEATDRAVESVRIVKRKK
jgi:CBS domain containing-hemolysin-like protein